MATVTIRDYIAKVQREVRGSDLMPERASQLLVKLTALIGNVNSEIREADLAYANVLYACLNSDEAANRAKIRAEISPEYQRKREARDTKELVLEMIRALKYALRCAEEEMRLAR